MAPSIFSNCCGSNPLSLSTSNPNSSVNQNACCCCGDGGLSGLASSLNAIGKWGSVITAQAQGRPVAVSSSGVKIGAAGATSLPGNISSNTLIIVLVIAAVGIFLAMRS
jgi:hypothetical protein